jgi:hypothetical protein
MVQGIDTFVARRKNEQTDSAAQNRISIEGRKTVFYAKTFNLATDKDQFAPEVLNFQFRSFWVISTTDNTCQVTMIPNDVSEGQLNGAITLKQNLAIKNGFPFSGAQFYWSAQSGKTMTVLFFVDADVTPGSQITNISGGVTISAGSSRSDAALASTQDQPSVTIGASPTMIFPADSARLGAELEVAGGTIKLGGSGITSTNGATRNDGDRWDDANTGALYGILVSGTPKVTGIVYK